MTLYPDTKVTPQRAVDIIEMYGSERIWMNSAGDWGCSDPLAVPKARLEMKRRGHTDEIIDRVTLHNPETFLSQSNRFHVDV
jgi:predicted metal-dependent TIM-barrel fold hydrolase